MPDKPVVITITGARLARLPGDALFNHFAVEVSLLTVDARDTTFSYQVSLRTRVNSARLSEIRQFSEGFAECWRVLG